LREQAHLRGRTNTFGAVTRVRNNLAYATHQFFQQRGFLYIHTPIITASDCEGAGEMFQVTTVLPPTHEPISKAQLQDKLKTPKTPEEIKAMEDAEKAAEEAQAAKDAAEGKKPKKDKKKKKDKGKGDDHLFNFSPIPLEEQLVDYKKDMFSKPAFLSVSGQLNVETVTVGLGDSYTFGPTFRAENSHTSRHLCEFWMIEPELAFATIQDDMECAEDYLKFCLRYVLENNKDDLEFFDERIEKGLIARLTSVVAAPFKKVPYTECVEILQAHLKDKKLKLKFENEVFWGCDLASEHEKYLTDKVFCGPIIVYNYPKDIKAFYMKMNEDGKTVQAMDLLVPRIGELIGGSAREDNLEKLDKRLAEMKLNKEDYWWYRDLRKYGSVPHAGFGLGFERLVMMATGIENIRDVIPFPRAPGQAEF
jgi:asparaginyl-tRNA synthetase